MAFSADVLDTLPREDLPQILPKICDGDILLCSARDPFSKLIRWSTKSPWSHVAHRLFLARDGTGAGVRMRAAARRPRRLADAVHQRDQHREPTLIPARSFWRAIATRRRGDALRPLADFAVNAMGDRFSPLEIARIGARIAFGRMDLHMPKAVSARNEFICSEYVAQCFKAVGIEIEWDGLGFIAPADFALDAKIDAVAQFKTR